MNRYGSYRKLRDNSKQAILAAIEIYNKPSFAYRNECFVILLVNAWELLLKAILSKNKHSIFYPKKRTDKHYYSLSIYDALENTSQYFPQNIPYETVRSNLNLLIEYRNSTVHFYNEIGFEAVVYGLAQASIKNFRDLLEAVFYVDIANEMNLVLLPLAFGTTLDPIQFIQQASKNPKRSEFISHFLQEISSATIHLEEQGYDTSRLIATFSVKLESVKKITAADIVVGLNASTDLTNTRIIEKRFDPNDPNWGRRKEVLEHLPKILHGVNFTSHTFEAIIWKYDIKSKPNQCWRDKDGTLTKYSFELVSFIKNLSQSEIEQALQEYKQRAK